MENRCLLEELLRSWMAMEVCIRGNRLLSDLSMNEMLICSALYQRGDAGMSATELCGETRLLKSQMNHLLNTLEYEGMIRRERSLTDKRTILVFLREDAVPRYLREHEHVLNIVGAVCGALGDEDTRALAQLMQKAAVTVSRIKE